MPKRSYKHPDVARLREWLTDSIAQRPGWHLSCQAPWHWKISYKVPVCDIWPTTFTVRVHAPFFAESETFRFSDDDSLCQKLTEVLDASPSQPLPEPSGPQATTSEQVYYGLVDVTTKITPQLEGDQLRILCSSWVSTDRLRLDAQQTRMFLRQCAQLWQQLEAGDERFES